MSKNIDYLREHGPTAIQDLPVTSIPISDRRNGVWRLRPNIKSNSVTDIARGRTNAIAYLRDEHDLIDVVEAFFEENPNAAPATKGELRGYKLVLSDEWKPALVEYYHGEAGPQ